MIKGHSRFWYFFKKSFLIFPHAGGARSDGKPYLAARELAPFYDRLHDEAGLAKRAYWRLLRMAFMAWIGPRARRLAKKHKLSDERRTVVERIAKARYMDPRDVLINDFTTTDEPKFYVRRFEEAAINRLMNPQYWTGECEMDDKIAFAARCERSGLPHPPLLATCVNGVIEARALPKTGEIFVKPLHGTGGIGAAAYKAPAFASLEDFKAFLKKTAGAKEDWLAQDRLGTHPALADIALNALSTMRVYTILDEDGRAEVVSTSVKLSTHAASVVDNGAGVGIHVGVDLETGRLGVGAGRGHVTAHEANPANGVHFKGREMPLYRDIVEIALRAHNEVFPDYTYAGFDLAPTDTGVWLIEGNAKASMVAAQRPILRTMPPERFVKLVALNMERPAPGLTKTPPEA